MQHRARSLAITSQWLVTRELLWSRKWSRKKSAVKKKGGHFLAAFFQRQFLLLVMRRSGRRVRGRRRSRSSGNPASHWNWTWTWTCSRTEAGCRWHGRNWLNRRGYDWTRSPIHCFRQAIEVADRSARHSESG